ncbi:hypothetical protein RhiXN_11683 [Rhizoctonia solani]|uniref:Uncharacterized protein n=1 Tax=Rhizoctonia solani TaxID=456999 RepID=A0A8H8P6I0_9AGAM|nr:uncharacterized protein RhiXN_11683 [Rhizoctonia solani]QRW24771.1 hypothetical protein RhiXN_11683 [Rhizoctonia solani]
MLLRQQGKEPLTGTGMLSGNTLKLDSKVVMPLGHDTLESRESIVPAGPEGQEDIGVLPQEGRRFRRKGKCYLLTYACYVKSEETRETSCHEVIKDLVDHLLTLRSGANSLLEYAMGVTESHDLREGEWQPDWHCHVIVWARTLISSEALNLWKYKGVRPHERLLVLRDDKGRFAPLSAYEYLKKEADAWEARYGTLTEEFLLGQCPAGLKAKTNRNEDFAYAMEAEDAEGFFGRLKECQPCDMAMGYNNLKAFTGYFYRDKGALPQGVCEPKALKKATVNLPPGVQDVAAKTSLTGWTLYCLKNWGFARSGIRLVIKGKNCRQVTGHLLELTKLGLASPT